MTEPPYTEAPLDPPERELAGRLTGDRPVPTADFRGALGRRLLAEDPGYGPRPELLRVTVAVYLAAGASLLGLGALQAMGAL